MILTLNNVHKVSNNKINCYIIEANSAFLPFMRFKDPGKLAMKILEPNKHKRERRVQKGWLKTEAITHALHSSANTFAPLTAHYSARFYFAGAATNDILIEKLIPQSNNGTKTCIWAKLLDKHLIVYQMMLFCWLSRRNLNRCLLQSLQRNCSEGTPQHCNYFFFEMWSRSYWTSVKDLSK